jgi:hypothetical protein
MILKDIAALDGVYKLHGGNLMGCNLRDAGAVMDAGRMSCRVVLSVERVDRSGDVVVLKGIDLSAHRRIPTVLFGHNRDLIVGQAEDPGGAYTVRVEGDRLVAETYFHKHTEFGEQAFRLVETKVLRGASIGFFPDASLVTKSGRVGLNGKDGHIFGKSELIEYSHIPIPDNNECIVEAVYKGFGGKPLAAPLLDMLKPFAPERPATVTSGFDNQREKGMGRNDPNSPDLSTGAPEDEFMPPDDDVDPNADPNADPHADHKQVVDQAVEDMLASIYTKFTQGSLDMKGAVKLFKECLSHHGKVADINGGDGGGEGFGDDGDAEGDDEFGDSFDEDGDEGDDSDADADSDSSGPPKPDLEDKAKKKAEKAVATIWTKSYAPVMTATAEGLAHIVAASDPDARKIQKFARQLLDRMGRAPEFHGLVTKALADAESPWAEWEGAFFGRK